MSDLVTINSKLQKTLSVASSTPSNVSKAFTALSTITEPHLNTLLQAIEDVRPKLPQDPSGGISDESKSNYRQAVRLLSAHDLLTRLNETASLVSEEVLAPTKGDVEAMIETIVDVATTNTFLERSFNNAEAVPHEQDLEFSLWGLALLTYDTLKMKSPTLDIVHFSQEEVIEASDDRLARLLASIRVNRCKVEKHLQQMRHGNEEDDTEDNLLSSFKDELEKYVARKPTLVTYRLNGKEMYSYGLEALKVEREAEDKVKNKHLENYRTGKKQDDPVFDCANYCWEFKLHEIYAAQEKIVEWMKWHRIMSTYL